MGEFKRNVWCKYYNKCLDRAVETGKDFTCKGCKYENDRHQESNSDNFGSYLLLLAIYFPESYRSYRRIEKSGNLVIVNKFERLITDFLDGFYGVVTK